MQHVVVEDAAQAGRTYAQPLSGLRVSWGSVLAGAVATLAVALILWALALSIVALATHPAGPSLRSAVIALWICAMATTLIGAFVGGSLAGYLPGNGRPGIGAAHGFLAWCVAFLLVCGAQVFVLRGVVATASTAALDVAAATATSGAAGAPSAGEQNPGAATPGTSALSRADAARAGHLALNAMVGLGWSWFGTWILACALCVAAAAMGARRVGLREAEESEPSEREHSLEPRPPLTPAPSA